MTIIQVMSTLDELKPQRAVQNKRRVPLSIKIISPTTMVYDIYNYSYWGV